MNDRSISNDRMGMWILAAMSGPLAHFSGCGWVVAALTAAAMLPLAALPLSGWEKLGRIWCGLELLWIMVIAGILLRGSGAYWQAPGSEWFVPTVLLVLAAWNAGAKKQARVGSVLVWFLLVLCIPILLAALAQIRWSGLQPEASARRPELTVALLLPALGGNWNREGRGKACILAGVIAAVIAVLVQGVLPWAVLESVQTPFYEMCRSLTAGGICWELPAAIAVTLGWYALAGLFVSAGSAMAQTFGVPVKIAPWLVMLGAVWVGAAGLQLDGWLLVTLTVILWILVPFLHTNVKREKYRKK